MEHFSLKLPKKCSLEQFLAWQGANPDWHFERQEDGKTLQILEKTHLFADFDFIEIRQAQNFRFTEKQYEKLCRLNAESQISKIEMDFSKPQTLQIQMGTALIISLFTGAIYASLYFWAQKNRKGVVVTETARFDLKDQNGNVLRKSPDVALLSTAQMTDNELVKSKFISVAPMFCIEVVSSPKNGLKQTLQKMQKVWIENGTEIGLVLDPFGKNYYLFEAQKQGYEKISFDKLFTQPKLKDLQLDFEIFWKEAGGENLE